MEKLSKKPYIDLRDVGNVWISSPLEKPEVNIKRFGCIETEYAFFDDGVMLNEDALLKSIKSYFHMIDIATASGADIMNIAMPLLGSGSQGISASLVIPPLISECIAFLKRNESVKKLYFVDRNHEKANSFVTALKNSYSLLKEAEPKPAEPEIQPLVFISYTTPNKNVADNLCFKLESRGIRVWYAPRDVVGPYAAAIADAIEKATHFVVILSRETMLSQHVLNEIDLAFQRLPDKIKFKPLRIDTADLAPSFNYYLSRQHWMDAHVPPIEHRLDEFVTALEKDIK
jgi:O-acetyl-ADP-ribose deacetylase (regulator of RNase III)